MRLTLGSPSCTRACRAGGGLRLRLSRRRLRRSGERLRRRRSGERLRLRRWLRFFWSRLRLWERLEEREREREAGGFSALAAGAPSGPGDMPKAF